MKDQERIQVRIIIHIYRPWVYMSLIIDKCKWTDKPFISMEMTTLLLIHKFRSKIIFIYMF